MLEDFRMATLIIYLENTAYIDHTIDDLFDKTPRSLIDEVFVCDDNDLNYENDRVRVIRTDRVGRAAAWNDAARRATGAQVVFLRDTTKFSNNWLQPLVRKLENDRKLLVTPVIHSLDTNLWCSGESYIENIGWRWDLKLYNRLSESKYSPSVSPLGFAVNKSWLVELGGFDDNMGIGDGESLELSVRNWLFGGAIESVDGSVIAVSVKEKQNLSNLARIIEVWFPAFSSYFYGTHGVKPSDLSVGRLNNLTDLQDKQEITADGFLSAHLPELLSVYELMGSCSGKSIAIISDGPSADFTNPAWVYRHDLVIAVDYMGNMFDCDYVVTRSADIVTQLREKYADNKMVLPSVLESKAVGHLIDTKQVAPSSLQFEQYRPNDLNVQINPPFMNFGHSVHCAVHFALFLRPDLITLFGCDNKIIDGKSHSAKIQYYDDGKLWTDSEATRRRFAGFEYGLDRLGKLAVDSGIALMRVNHV